MRRVLVQFVGTGRNQPANPRPGLTLGSKRLGTSKVDEVWLVSAEPDEHHPKSREYAVSLARAIERARRSSHKHWRCRLYELPLLAESLTDPNDIDAVLKALSGPSVSIVDGKLKTERTRSFRQRLEDRARGSNDEEFIVSLETGSCAHSAALLEMADKIGLRLSVCYFGTKEKPVVERVADARLGGHRETGIRGSDETLRHFGRLPADGATVLLLGETGVGKTTTAKRLHEHWHPPGTEFHERFGVLNCAAIPKDLLESEIFGHVKGAFTGATDEKKGMLEAYAGGTLLLDEIGELPLAMQAKLLSVLQRDTSGGYWVRRVGSNKAELVSIRLIFATNRDLFQLVEEKTFRSDLLARIAPHTVRLEPLRERPQAALAGIMRALKDQARRFGAKIEVHRDAWRRVVAFCFAEETQWKWNYRDIEQSAERLVFNAYARQGYELAPPPTPGKEEWRAKRKAIEESGKDEEPPRPPKLPGDRIHVHLVDLDDELNELRHRWGAAPETDVVEDAWRPVRDALQAGVFERLSRIERWQARYLLEAKLEYPRSKAKAWRWLTETEQLFPPGGDSNPTQAFDRHWGRFDWR